MEPRIVTDSILRPIEVDPRDLDYLQSTRVHKFSYGSKKRRNFKSQSKLSSGVDTSRFGGWTKQKMK